MTIRVGNVFYRYEDRLFSAGVDDRGDPLGPPEVRLCLIELRVVRLTPKCAILDYYGEEKRILLSAHRRFACPTIEEAKISYRRRKLKQIEILTSQLDNIRKALNLLNNEKLEDHPDFERCFA